MSKLYLAKILVKDGNRMIVPGLWYEVRDYAESTKVLFDTLMYECVLDAKAEPDWLTIETDDEGRADIVHVLYDIIGRQFAHGGITVALIGGPLFDEARKR